MLTTLRHLSIGQRLYSNLALALMGMFALVVLVLYQYQNALLNDKRAQVQFEVDTVYSLIEHFHQQAKTGLYDEATAKRNAISAIKAIRYNKTDYFWINDMGPNMVMHPIKPKLDGQSLANVKDPNGKSLFVAFTEVVRKQGAGFVDYQWPKPGFEEPVDKISFVKGYQPWGWVIGTGIYLDDVQGLFLEMVYKVSAVFMAIAVTLLGLSTLIIASITKPLKQSAGAMSDIAQGEGNLTVTLESKGQDEITKLANNFNLFTQKIALLVRQMQPVSHNIGDTAAQLNHAVQSNHRIAEQQHHETDGVATAMNEMLATTQEVANSAQLAADSAAEANQRAQHGQASVDETISSIAALGEELEQTVSLVTQLEQDSQQIGSILDVIRSIAEQTNLLALNAAIEAARAGEQGRGFAVVADEVRTLATRTQDSTDEIQQMIAKLQKGTNDVANSVEQTLNQSSKTAARAGSAGTALSEIVASIDIITDMNHQIASAAEQQSKALDEINRNVNNISDLASESMSHNQTTSDASGQLQLVGQELNQLMGQFKV
ncbi:methyl-accepting chemotaxis protein [Motilimonas sp. 1_MG-2023]|uniref:methyl-accepting chemotaxis protein n=1 Tax=Motilimonas sp. 1_MG-2023 TaxID=3062672 RepID=UPI0026E1BDAB|nr:methyl-accepting chemotaxis protein [Motilimonas sp. 1_MG-2023]MDO6526475.1 methyl-accepting chemotaxis protein [Motilimonas sp. 1_MG-2023]